MTPFAKQHVWWLLNCARHNCGKIDFSPASGGGPPGPAASREILNFLCDNQAARWVIAGLAVVEPRGLLLLELLAGDRPGIYAFISYASEDREIACRVLESLRACDVPGWLDLTRLSPMATFSDAVLAAVDGCRWMIAIMSINSADKDWPLRERMRAIALNKPVVPLWIGMQGPKVEEARESNNIRIGGFFGVAEIDQLASWVKLSWGQTTPPQ